MICRRAALTLISLLASITLLAGCGGEELPPPEPVEEVQAEPLAFDVVGQGLRADVQDTLEVVVRDSARWAELRQQLRPAQPFQPVDFDESMVLLTALSVPSGGFNLNYESVDRTDSTVVATYLFAEPGDDCMTAMGRSVPFQAVAVSRADLPVRFERRRDTYRCTTDTGL